MPTLNQIHDYLYKTGKAIEVKGPIPPSQLIQLVAKFGADKVKVV